ncbi:MAG: SAM-dependent methyltransferase [Nitrospirales bacterium]
MALQSSLDPDALPQLIGDFHPVDEWQTHINEVFYGLRGARLREYYQTFASADYRLAYALAEHYFQHLMQRAASGSSKDGQVVAGRQSPLVVMEWGCGNGNLAACFLDRLKALDTDNRFYPLVEYHLIDKSDVVLNEAKNNSDLARHQERTTFTCGSLEELQAVSDGTVDRIICNELWSELPTKLVLRKAGDLSEEHLRPNVSESKLAEIEDWEGFVQAFDQKDIKALTRYPSFLEDLVWEREYHDVESKSLSFRRTIADFLKQIDEEVLVPVNTGAATTLKEAIRLLSPHAVGFSSFDAGTFDAHVLNDPEKPCYSVHGGQFSFMVNFTLLEDIAKHLEANVTVESQREFVGRHVGASVLTLMDLLAAHPYLPSPDSWEFDALVVRTLEALNTSYQSQYKRVIEFPLRGAMPSEEKTKLETILRDLKPEGVPDTIAYITESEIDEARSSLEQLGYDAEGIRVMLRSPAQLVDYTHFFLSVS